MNETAQLVIGVPGTVLERALALVFDRIPEVPAEGLAIFARSIGPVPADMQNRPELTELALAAVQALDEDEQAILTAAILQAVGEVIERGETPGGDGPPQA